MDLLEHPPSVAEEEISSPANGANADSTEPVNTWHEIFKSSSMNQHHGFVATIEQAIMLMKKYELETTTKFSCYKSDKMFGSGGKTFLSLHPLSHNWRNLESLSYIPCPFQKIYLQA